MYNTRTNPMMTSDLQIRNGGKFRNVDVTFSVFSQKRELIKKDMSQITGAKCKQDLRSAYTGTKASKHFRMIRHTSTCNQQPSQTYVSTPLHLHAKYHTAIHLCGFASHYYSKRLFTSRKISSYLPELYLKPIKPNLVLVWTSPTRASFRVVRILHSRII